MEFSQLGLPQALLTALDRLGYESPTPIQAVAIPLLLQGRDLLGTAQTGTGKTGAFALPLLARIDLSLQAPQVLVLTPTRELALQVAEAFVSYASDLPGFQVLPIYGGQDIRVQLRGLKRGPQVVVGTPGRLLDHLSRGSLVCDQLIGQVLDEADEMLRMGFIEDVEAILDKAPEGCQRMLFSATMPEAIARVSAKYLNQPEAVRFAGDVKDAPAISQAYVLVRPGDKLEALTRLLEIADFEAMIIFVRTKSATLELAERLMARGHSAAAISGDLNQSSRERVIDDFKSGRLDILVATDVAARGLDVDRVSHVYNYDIPYNAESYVHRIGRTGRAGRSGEALLFVTPKERRLLGSLMKATRSEIQPIEVPSSQDISKERVRQFRARVKTTLEEAPLETMETLVSDLLEASGEDSLRLAQALAYQLQASLPLYPELRELAVETRRPSKGRDRTEGFRGGQGDGFKPRRESRRQDGPETGMQRYRVDVGREGRATVGSLVAVLTTQGGLPAELIGRIQLMKHYSTVDLAARIPKGRLEALFDLRYKGQPLGLRPARPGEARPPWAKERHQGKKRPPKAGWGSGRGKKF